MHRVNLGGVLDTAIEMQWQPELYGEAVQTLQSELAAGTPGVPGTAELLMNLGRAHAARFLADEATEAHRAAADAFRQVIAMVTAPARTRAFAAQHLAVLCTRAGETAAAADAYSSALELLDLVAWRGLARDDQERALADFPGLGPAAAATANELGDPDRALSLLEQGRGVLLSQVLEFRAEYQLLHEAEPALAAELHQIHDAMEVHAREEQVGTDQLPGNVILARQELALRRSQLLKTIRGRHGLARFLLPPDAAVLRSAMPQGAVVALNVAGTRCDALITTPAATTVLPLPGLVLADAAERAALFLAAVNANAWGTNDVVIDTLAWLWDVAVEPVLHALERFPDPPRIWWMPTGALSFLPIHAAGHHRRCDGDRRSALHRALSSYTPNLRVLSRTSALRSAPRRMLVIGADPDPRSLTETEAVLVAARQRGEVTRLLGPAATKQAVLDHLPGCSRVHVASHAITDARNPSESRLNLSDDALRVREISTVRAGEAELAYLSACETAVGGVRVPDEAIHICTAFQLAGYRNVIATLWRVPGRAARDTAATVYSELGRYRPSQAVNLASQRLRESYRSNPYEWAAFIHSGSD
jgi:tetratricopeptide (TPR) repeat protein